jgi:L-lactate dehydrogenase complex protein LldE
VKVALFVPCFVDQFFPQVGVSAVKVLRKLGHEVVFPSEQTCCGQPAFNSGYWDEARSLAHRFVDVFEREKCDAVVSLSGSCTAMVRNFYPELLLKKSGYGGAGVPPVHSIDGQTGRLPHHSFSNNALATRLNKIRENTFEFSEFLVERTGVTDVGAKFDGKATYHDSCHALRELRMKDTPRILLAGVKGLELVEMRDTDQCCGFGGTFSVKFPMISTAMCESKVERIVETGAQFVISTDSSCLMQIQGLLDRRKIPIKSLHLAEVLGLKFP